VYSDEKHLVFAEKVRNQLLFSEFLVNKRVTISKSELMTRKMVIRNFGREKTLFFEKVGFFPREVGIFSKKFKPIA